MNLRKLIREEISDFDWTTSDDANINSDTNRGYVINLCRNGFLKNQVRKKLASMYGDDFTNSRTKQHVKPKHLIFVDVEGGVDFSWAPCNEFDDGEGVFSDYVNMTPQEFLKDNDLNEDFDWAEDIGVDPLHVGNYVYLDGTSDENDTHGDWEEGDYIILKITEVTDNEVCYFTSKTNIAGEGDTDIDCTDIDNARHLLNTRYWRPYNEKTGLFESEFDWAEKWVDDTPTERSEYYFDYGMGEPVLVRVVGVINDIVRFKNLDDDFISSHREMFYDDEYGWDVIDSIHLDSFMKQSKKVDLNEDFDWIEAIKPFNLNDCNWIIETTNGVEWNEVERFLFNKGWIWGDGNSEGSDYDGQFHFFFPDDHFECGEEKFDAANEDYFYTHGGDLNDHFENHKFMRWSEIRNQIINEDFEWAEETPVDPITVGERFKTPNGSILRITKVDSPNPTSEMGEPMVIVWWNGRDVDGDLVVGSDRYDAVKKRFDDGVWTHVNEPITESDLGWMDDAPSYDIKVGDDYSIPSMGQKDVRVRVVEPHGASKFRLRLHGGIYGDGTGETFMSRKDIIEKLQRGFWVNETITESEFDWVEKTPSAEKLPHWTGRSDGTEPGGNGRSDKVFIYTDEDGVEHSVKNGGTKYLGFDGVGGVSFYDSSITNQQIDDLNHYGAAEVGDPFEGMYEVELTRPEYNQAVRDGRMKLQIWDNFYSMNESE